MDLIFKLFINHIFSKGKSIFFLYGFLLLSQTVFSQTYRYACDGGSLTGNVLKDSVLYDRTIGASGGAPDDHWVIISDPTGTLTLTNPFDQDAAVFSAFEANETYILEWWDRISPIGGYDYNIYTVTVEVEISNLSLSSFSAVTPPATYLCASTDILPASPELNIALSGGTPNYIVRVETTDGSATSTRDIIMTGLSENIIMNPVSSNTDYKIIYISDANGCTATGLPSGTISYTVFNPTVANVTGTDVCEGTSATIGLDGSETGVTYELRRGATVADTHAGTGGAFNFADQTVVGTYEVYATDGSCDVQMNGSVTILPALSVYNVSIVEPAPYCAGNNYTIQLSNSDVGVTYRLYRDATLVSSQSGTGGVISFTNISTAGTYSIVADDGVCTAVMSPSGSLTINSPPTPFNVTGGSVCEPNAVTIGLSGSESGVRYELYRNPGNNLVYTLIGSGNFGDQTVVGTYTVVATNTTTGCVTNMNGSAAVNPLPADQAFKNTGQVCPSGEVALLSSEVGVRYELFRDGASTGSTLNGTGNAVTFGVQTIAGTYTVEATITSIGCSLVLTDQLEILPQPNVYDLTANRTTYCSSAAVTGVDLTLSGSDNGVSYQLMKNGNPEGGVRIGDGNTIVWTNVDAGSYVVQASNVGGCSLQMNYNPVITAAPAPTATIAAQTPNRRCENIPGTFNITVTLTGTPPYNFDIVDDKGNITVNVVGHTTDSYTITVNPVTTTTYTVQNLTDAASCLPQNGTGSAIVYIDPIPVITFNPADPEVCAGSSITVTAYGAGAGGSYSWSDGLGNNQSISVAPASTHDYTVTATTSLGCFDDSTVTVTVNPLPSVDFWPPGSPAVYEYCENDADVTLTGNPTGGSYGGTGIYPAGSENFSPSHANIGNNDITYTYADTKGCVNSVTKQFVVNEVPNVSINGLSPDYCADAPRVTVLGTPASGTPAGTVGYFEIIGYGPGNGQDVFWHDNGDGTMWFDPGISISTNGAEIPYTVRYTYTNLSGCTDFIEASTIVHNDMNNLVGFTGLPVNACQDDSKNYTLQGQMSGVNVSSGIFTGPNPGLTDNGDGTAIFNPSLAGNGTHTISFTYTDLNGCTGSHSETITIGTDLSINALSDYCKTDAAFLIDGTPDGGTVTLRDAANNIISSGADNTVNFDLAVLTAGTYHIEYEYLDGNGCNNSRIWDVELHPQPGASFTYELDGSGNEINHYCVSEEDVILTPAVVGGSFTGTAVSGNIFNPSVAGVGAHNITYTITQNGCTTVNTRSDMWVIDLPDIDFYLPADTCDYTTAFTIQANNYGTPGGMWTFTSTTNTVGVSPITDNGDGSAVFDPSVGVGSYQVTMTYTDPAQGCENSVSKIITILETAEVNFGGANDLLEFCQDDTPITLTASFTSSGVPVTTGVFTGDGITDNGDGTAIFDPAGLIAGDHPVTYEYTNGNGCVSTRTKTFRILDYPAVYSVTGGGDYCVANSPSGLPVGLSDSELGVNYELLLNGLSLSPQVIVPGNDTDGDGQGDPISFGNQAAPGIYTVQAVNAASGCSVMMNDSAVIKINDVTLVVTTTDVSCNGGNDGTAVVTASGGTTNYVYQWTDASGNIVANSDTAKNLTAGTYEVTVVDAVGCSAVKSGIVINEPANALTVSVINITDVASCGCTTGTGECEGSAEVSITGGTPNYSILWSTGGTGTIESDLEPGNHSVSVTDNKGCIVAVPFTVNKLPDLTIVEDISQHSDNTCNGGTDGTLGVTVGGGSGNYECSIDSTAWFSGTIFTGLAAGNYNVWVRDASYPRCVTKIANPIVITEPAPLTLAEVITSHVDVDCNGGSTGELEVLAGGGSGVYEYSKDAGASWQSSPKFTNLNQGSYTIWVRDAADNTCVYTGMAPVLITQPSPLDLSVTSVTDVSCNGEADGEVVLSATGGSGNYVYSIDGGANWVASNTFSNLAAGTYNFIVSDASAVSCVLANPVTVTITQPDDFTVTAVKTDVSCFGGNDGTITVTPVTPAPGRQLEYSIDGGVTWQSGTVFSGLTAGNYKVSVRDIENAPVICTKTDEVSVDITQPASALSIDNFVITDVTCNGGNNGSIDINVSGGTAAYFYQWTDGLGYAVGGNTDNPTGLVTGNYTVVVTDAKGCQVNATYPVAEPSPWDVQYIVTHVSTNGGSDGAIDIHTIAGNTGPYTVTWDDDNTNHDLLRTGLTAGTYGFVVVDANGCDTTIADIHVTEPGPLTVILTGSDVSCFGGNNGSVKVEITSGNPDYVVHWSGNLLSGGTVSGTYDPAPTTLLIDNREAGTYTIDVSDNAGNTFSGTVVVGQPDELVITPVNLKDITCFGGNDGEVTVSVSGGNDPSNTGSYSMIWNGPNGFTKSGTVTAERSQTGLDTPGQYNITVTDGNGCPVNASYSIAEPDELTVNVVNVKDVTCNGGNDGEIAITVSGRPAGNGYVYDWYKWNGTTSVWDVYQLSGTATMINLEAGIYQARITSTSDACTAVSSDITVAENGALALSTTVKNITSCNGDNSGELTVDVSGGVGPFTLDYGDPSDTRTGNGPFVISGLVAGVYTVTVTDANLCTVTETYTITEPDAMVVNNVSYSMDCINDDSGILNFTITGGSIDVLSNHQYFISLSGPNGISYTRNETVPAGASYSSQFTNLPAGSYTFEVQDKLSSTPLACGYVLDFDLDLISISGNITNATCKGVNTGSVTGITINGSSGNYTYLWTTVDGQGLDNSTLDQAGLSAGTYNLSITDNTRSCTVDTSFVVENANTLVISGSVKDVTCAGGNDGAVTNISVTDATPVINYSWTGPNGFTASTDEITNVEGGTYQLDVIDANGCAVS